MKYLSMPMSLVLLTAMACGCVTAQRHENLQAERDELRQSLDTNKQMLEDAKRVHLTAAANYEQNISNLRQQLADKTREANSLRVQLGQLQKEYDAASRAASKVAQDNLALLDEKKELNDSIIELNGTIATLQDTIKDLEARIEELSAEPEPPPSSPSSSESNLPSE